MVYTQLLFIIRGYYHDYIRTGNTPCATLARQGCQIEWFIAKYLQNDSLAGYRQMGALAIPNWRV